MGKPPEGTSQENCDTLPLEMIREESTSRF